MNRKRSEGRRSRAGFTLIELLVVVMIIGILASIGIPQYYKVVERSRIAEIQSLVSTIRSAQERYYTRHGSYSNDVSKLDVAFASCSTSGSTCGMKSYKMTTLTATAALCGNAPGYEIIATRATDKVGVAAKYGPYTITYNRCSEGYVFAAGAGGVPADMADLE